MPGIQEAGAHARAQLDRLPVTRHASKHVEGVQRIELGIERSLLLLVAPTAGALAGLVLRLVLLQVRGVQQHQPRELA